MWLLLVWADMHEHAAHAPDGVGLWNPAHGRIYLVGELMRFKGLLFALVVVCASSLAEELPIVRDVHYPALNPDGGKVALSFQGDLWVAAVDDGIAARLTVIDNGSGLRNAPDDPPTGFDGEIAIELRGWSSLGSAASPCRPFDRSAGWRTTSGRSVWVRPPSRNGMYLCAGATVMRWLK